MARIIVQVGIVLAFLLLSACLDISNDNLNSKTITIQAVGNLQRFAPFEKVKGQTAIHIKAAKNEYEGFQAIINSNLPSSQVDITLSPLLNQQGERLSNIKIYRERYIDVTVSTPDSPYAPQAWPDILLEKNINNDKHVKPSYQAFPYNLTAGENLPIWVDVYVPSNATAGDYVATLNVLVDGKLQAQLPIKLTVWDFTLPKQIPLASSFGTASYRIAEVYGFNRDRKQAKQNTLIRAYYDLLIDHHLAPIDYWDAVPEKDQNDLPNVNEKIAGLGTVTQNLQYYLTKRKLNTYIYTFADNFPFADALAKDKLKAQRFLKSYIDWCQHYATNATCYTNPTLMDEPETAQDYAYIKKWGRFFDELPKPSRQKINFLITEPPLANPKGLDDIRGIVDTWIPKFYDLWQDIDYKKTNISHQQLAKGDQLWAYTALTLPMNFVEFQQVNPKADALLGNYPFIWQLDYPAINYRLPTWLFHQYGVTGWLYYDTLQTGKKNAVDIWHNPASFIVQERDHELIFNGDGLLIYPGFADDYGLDAPVPSLRLKWLREAVEDYVYIELLYQHGQVDFAHQQIQRIARNFADWQNDPELLMQVRDQLGSRLATIITSGSKP
jgi:hypothetical protein